MINRNVKNIIVEYYLTRVQLSLVKSVKYITENEENNNYSVSY